MTSGGGCGVAIRTYVEQVQQHRGDFIEAMHLSVLNTCVHATDIQTWIER